ncbi:MAG: L7Ae/L30e/S12e/Gadd45 family ribosomal protein [Peptococcia bacterium]|jgi:large subunit ribosomal protein L7A
MHRLKDAEEKVVGYKQSLKTVEKGRAQLVFLAKNAPENLRVSILEICLDRGVPVVEADSMAELGKSCGIQVEASVAAVLAPK